MKAIEITQPGVVRVIERPQPQVAAGEALLRVRRVGFCGTDLSTFRGRNPLVEYPRIPGHEVAATIEGFGPGATGPWQLGQPVLIVPYAACAACSACRAGRPNCCRNNRTLGVQRDGAMAEYFTAPLDKLLTSPRLTLPELALVEPLTVGFHAAARGRISASDAVLIFGSGAIGLGAIAGAAARGARVIAVDVDDSKRSIALACGAAHFINSRTESLHDQLQELTAGHGPDVAIEAVGLPETFVAAVEEVCFAGRVVYIGYSKAPVAFDTKHFILKELDILGSRNALLEDFRAVLLRLESGAIPSATIITETCDLAAAPDRLAAWDRTPGEFVKIQVSLDDD